MTRDQSGRWGTPRTLLKGGAAGIWSPDGTKIVTQMPISGGKFAVAVVPAGGGSPRVVGTPQDEADGGVGWAFSRDSKFVYYFPTSRPTGGAGIWRVPVEGGASHAGGVVRRSSGRLQPFSAAG